MNFLNQAPPDAAQAVARWLADTGEPPFRVRQIVPRLWQRPVKHWGAATELPRRLADELERVAPLPTLQAVARERSSDGTTKFLWRLPDGASVESVWIPEGRRTTLCISSQAGCAYGCVFCATGRMGFHRHLTPWEIVGQVRELMLDPAYGKPRNVVFMGMGEPLHNWRAVDIALTMLNHAHGLRIGARHITVSTVGILPNLAKLAARPEQFRLAVSLHGATSARRAALMPVEHKYGLDELVPALAAFARRVTLEYVLIRGVNDSDDDAAALASIARPLGALVNLLPLHPGGAPHLAPTTPAGRRRFAARLRASGVRTTLRRSRGLDIRAACGQLRVETAIRREIPSQNHAHV